MLDEYDTFADLQCRRWGRTAGKSFIFAIRDSWENDEFPAIQFATTELRKAVIESYIDSIESNLYSTDNADKPIFTFFDINPQTE
ncbi:MAG: hypothetical protein GZ094_20245 [Mariniphaga sp.]|nr:hypothetical protein [Mariniphaga sp.]